MIRIKTVRNRIGEPMSDTIKKLTGGLIVSCQVDEANPMSDVIHIKAMAEAVCVGGCVGVRINGAEYVRAVKTSVSVPVIGIIKRHYEGSPVYITPTQLEVEELIDAGADIIALDGTSRDRPRRTKLLTLIDRIHAAGKLAMADVSILEEGIRAANFGVDLVATTLSGYTSSSNTLDDGPDLGLVQQLSRSIGVPIVAEGRIRTSFEARNALDLGAHAVVVGTAITNPTVMTERFVAALSDLDDQRAAVNRMDRNAHPHEGGDGR